MSENNDARYWWQSLPAILGGIAAIVTAVTALIAGIQAIFDTSVIEPGACDPKHGDNRKFECLFEEMYK